MNKIITQYLIDECNKSDAFVASCIQKMESHPDIMKAFVVRDFRLISAPVVMGIDVVQLYMTGKLTPVGVFNYLIYLRNKPDEALEALQRGLPRK